MEEQAKPLDILHGLDQRWRCVCGQVYRAQSLSDLHAALKGTDGIVTKGLLRVRVFCTVGDGHGLIEAHYPNVVASR